MKRPLISLFSLLAVTTLSVGVIVPALAAEPTVTNAAPTTSVEAPATVDAANAAPDVAKVALWKSAAAAAASASAPAAFKPGAAVRANSKAPKPKKAVVKRVAAKPATTELQTAQRMLASLQAKYKHLDGVTVSIGTTPGGYQAVSYYTKGRILISSKHTVSISRIMEHEIWHCIDWSDNGRIDWGENVAPKNAASYLK